MMLQRVDSDTTTSHNRHGSRTFLLTFLVRSQLSIQSLDKLELTLDEMKSYQGHRVSTSSNEVVLNFRKGRLSKRLDTG